MVITSLPFTACSKEDYPRDSLFLEDPGSPFQAQDYDAIYLYQFGRIPEEAVKENSIITGGRISITALVKDGIVISVFTNIPVAGRKRRVYTKNKTAGLLLTAMAAAILLSGCTSEKPVETSQNAPPRQRAGRSQRN